MSKHDTLLGWINALPPGDPLRTPEAERDFLLERDQLIRELAERTETKLTEPQIRRVRRLMIADENLAFIDAAGAVLEEDRRLE